MLPTDIERQLEEIGLTLPQTIAPVANYVTARRTGNLLHLSGHVCRKDGEVVKGKLGETIDSDTGYRLARAAAIDMLSSARSVLGSLNAVAGVIKLAGFVNCTPGFTEQSAVVNGASDLLVEVFGDERGKHARSAVGVAALPLGAAVEIEAIFEVAT